MLRFVITENNFLFIIDNIIYNTENLEKECNKIGIDINKKFEKLNEKYGYENTNIYGLKDWYTDYMQNTIKNGKN